MGYSHSIHTVRRRNYLLTGILRREQEVTFSCSSAEEALKLAYQLRECFYIARRKPHEFPILAERAKEYSVRVTGNRVVAVRPPSQNDVSSEYVSAHISHVPDVPVQLRRSIPFAGSSAAVIQAWLDDPQPTEFADAPLTPVDEGEVIRWANQLEPPWEIIRKGKKLILQPQEISQ